MQKSIFRWPLILVLLAPLAAVFLFLTNLVSLGINLPSIGPFGFNIFAGFFLLIQALWWIAIIGVAIWLATKLFSKSPTNSASPNYALDILNQRYARGEITRDEYLRMKKDLES